MDSSEFDSNYDGLLEDHQNQSSNQFQELDLRFEFNAPKWIDFNEELDLNESYDSSWFDQEHPSLEYSTTREPISLLDPFDLSEEEEEENQEFLKVFENAFSFSKLKSKPETKKIVIFI